jgi:hypothetical protein
MIGSGEALYCLELFLLSILTGSGEALCYFELFFFSSFKDYSAKIFFMISSFE